MRATTTPQIMFINIPSDGPAYFSTQVGKILSVGAIAKNAKSIELINMNPVDHVNTTELSVDQ